MFCQFPAPVVSAHAKGHRDRLSIYQHLKTAGMIFRHPVLCRLKEGNEIFLINLSCKEILPEILL